MKSIIKISIVLLLFANGNMMAQNYTLSYPYNWDKITTINDNDLFTVWNTSGLKMKTVRWDTIVSALNLEAATNYFETSSTNLYPNLSTYNLILGGTTAPASTKLYVVGNSNLTGNMTLGGNLTLSPTNEIFFGGGAKIRSDGTGDLQFGDASNSYTSLSDLLGSSSLFSKSGSNIYPGTSDNLLLGTTANSSNYRLRVSGAVNVTGIMKLGGSLKLDGEVAYGSVNGDTVFWDNNLFDDAGIFIGYSAGDMTFFDANNANTTLSDLASVTYSELTGTPADVNSVGLDSATVWGTRKTTGDTLSTTVFEIGDSTFVASDFYFSGEVSEAQLSDSTRAAVTESNTYTDNQITNFSDTLTRGEVTETQLSDSTRAAVTESNTYTDTEIQSFSDTLTRGDVTESQLSDSTRAAVTESNAYTDASITDYSSIPDGRVLFVDEDTLSHDDGFRYSNDSTILKNYQGLLFQKPGRTEFSRIYPNNSGLWIDGLQTTYGGGDLYFALTDGLTLVREAATYTNPVFTLQQKSSGLGGSDYNISLIANSTEIVRITDSAAVFKQCMYSDSLAHSETNDQAVAVEQSGKIVKRGTKDVSEITVSSWDVTNLTSTKNEYQYSFGARDTVASSTTISLGLYNSFTITGTSNIETISSSLPDNIEITLHFTGTASATGLVDDTGNLKLSGNFAYTPDDIVKLKKIGSNWHEISTSSN